MDCRSFDWKARFAAKVMHLGGVIAYPTEAVWGLGCDPYNEYAVHRILALKDRPVEKGLILLSGNKKHFRDLLAPFSSEQQDRFFEAGKDRPVTWLVRDVNNLVPSWIKGEHTSVAIRYTRHPLSSMLSQHFGGVIVSTSANPAGMPEARNLFEAKKYFGDRLDKYVQGPLGNSRQVSKICDLETGAVLRD